MCDLSTVKWVSCYAQPKWLNGSNWFLIFRPPDIVVSGLSFAAILLLLLSSFIRQLPSELAHGTQPKPAKRNQNRKRVRFENVCPKSGVYPPPANRGSKPHFWRLRYLTATLITYIFGTKHDMYNRASALALCIVSKCHELWSTNGLNLDCHFTRHP